MGALRLALPLHNMARAGGYLAAQPNIGLLHRMIYFFGGLLLAAAGFNWVEAEWLRIAMPIGGAMLVVQGLIGWCGTVAMFGGGRRQEKK